MAFRFESSAQQQKPRMTTSSSPTFSTLGRSPSIGPPAYTTDDLLAAKNQKQAGWLHILRIVIAGVTLATSIAVITCAAVSLRAYSESSVDAEWLLPLWPLNVDLRPSHTVLGCGITIAAFSLIYLAAAFAPMPGKLHKLNILSSIAAFLCLFATLFTTIFAAVITNNAATSTSTGTLNSWTCKWQGFESVAPAKFTEICNEGTAALDLVIFLVIVEFLAVGVTAWGWLIETKMKKVSVDGGKEDIQLV